MNDEFFNLLCPFQRRWVMEKAPVAIAQKSRRIGWTWTHALVAVLGRIDKHAPKSNYYHSSADATAAREFIEYCAEWARMARAVAVVTDETEVIEEREIHTKVMTFSNGRKIVAGTSNPTFFRSKGGEVGLDEFAFHRDGRQMYKAALATARFWAFPMRIWSTHNGPGSYFNHLIGEAKTGKLRAAVHTVTILDAVEDGIVERIIMRKKKLHDPPAPDPKARQEWLDQLRAECPDEDVWNEEFLCVPSSDANSLLSYDLIAACERSNADLCVVSDPRDLKFNGPITVGWDVGRKRDLSVIWALGRVGDVFETRLLKRFANATYQHQEDYFNLLMSEGGVRRACIDATGLGNMLAERAVQRFGSQRVEAITFTPQVKADLAVPLRRLFEDKLVRVPADASVREGLHKVRKITTSAGNVRFDAKHDEDGHADEFWALALAYHAADATRIPLPRPMAAKPIGC